MARLEPKPGSDSMQGEDLSRDENPGRGIEGFRTAIPDHRSFCALSRSFIQVALLSPTITSGGSEPL